MKTVVEFDPRCHFDVGTARRDPDRRALIVEGTRALIELLGRHQGQPPGCRTVSSGPPEQFGWRDGHWTIGYTVHEEDRLALRIPPFEHVVVVRVRRIRFR